MEMKQNGSGKHLHDAQPRRLSEAHLKIGNDCRVTEGDDEHHESESGEVARRDSAGGDASKRHHEDERESAVGEGETGSGCSVAEQLLRELRLENGVGIEHAADQHHEKAADGEVSVAKETQVDERIFLVPLPDEEADDADDEECGEDADEGRGEPVILFALIEHDLEAAHGQGEKTEADVIHVAQLGSGRLLIHGGSSTRRVTRMKARMPTGMLMKKIQRQEKLSVIQPPRVGPMDGASTATRP